MQRICSFDPIWLADARVLILGTMPSVRSLVSRFYYAHPRNCFWPMMAEILDAACPIDLIEKARLLTEHRLALWDVAASCEREGSLDAAIRREIPNDLPGLRARCPDLRRVLLNGGTAFSLYHRHFPAGLGVEATQLPSTSPAYTLPYEKKLEAWRRAIWEDIA